MWATETKSRAATATPLSFRTPAPGSVVISTACRLLAGESFGSLDRKSVVKGKSVDLGGRRIVINDTAGASLTEVTLIVIELGDWSVSTPPLAVPPVSWTWKVKLA